MVECIITGSGKLGIWQLALSGPMIVVSTPDDIVTLTFPPKETKKSRQKMNFKDVTNKEGESIDIMTNYYQRIKIEYEPSFPAVSGIVIAGVVKPFVVVVVVDWVVIGAIVVVVGTKMIST